MSNNKQFAYPDLLDESYVFTALLDHGMMPAKVPACLTSKDLGEALKKLESENDLQHVGEGIQNYRDYIRYSASRHDLISRDLGIPHPLVYFELCKEIRDSWAILNTKSYVSNKKNYTHIKKIIDKPYIFEMNNGDKDGKEDKEKYEEENVKAMLQLGAQYCVSVDISRCYSSIHTQAVAWAIEGKEIIRDRDEGSQKLLGDRISHHLRNMNNQQPLGILIGPHASNIISELILSRIDNNLVDRGFGSYVRHIDDYEYYTQTKGKANKFIRLLERELAVYDLKLNAKKTQIKKLPDRDKSWKDKLNQFNFSMIKEDRITSRINILLEENEEENLILEQPLEPLRILINIFHLSAGKKEFIDSIKTLHGEKKRELNLEETLESLIAIFNSPIIDKQQIVYTIKTQKEDEKQTYKEALSIELEILNLSRAEEVLIMSALEALQKRGQEGKLDSQEILDTLTASFNISMLNKKLIMYAIKALSRENKGRDLSSKKALQIFMASFTLPQIEKKQIGFTLCQAYLTLALSLTKTGDMRSLTYAIKVLRKKGEERELSPRAALNTLRKVFNLCIHYPYLCPLIEDLRSTLRECIKDNGRIPEEKAKELNELDENFVPLLITHSVHSASTDALAYGLYFARKYKVDLSNFLDTNTVNKICDIKDCISLVLLWEYMKEYPSQNSNNSRKQLIEFAERKNSDKFERDQFWLFIYIVLESSKIKDPFLKRLKKTNFKFIDWTREAGDESYNQEYS